MANKFNDHIHVSDQQRAATETLRQRAEQDSRMAADTLQGSASAEETAQLVHELQVHQIELEMQNEELRETQLKLQLSQARYFDLYDLAPVGYLTINDKGLIVESNLTAAVMLGVAKSTLVKRPLSQSVHPEDQDTYYRYCRQLLSGRDKGDNICEIRMLREGGELMWAQLQSMKIQDKASESSQLRIIISDITERRQVEKKMHESEQRLSLVMKASGEGFWDWDIASERVLHNQKWFDLLGINKNTQVDHKPSFFTKLIHKDDRGSVLAKIRQALTTTGRFQSEHRLRRMDDSYIWVHENGIIVDRDTEGKPLRMVGSLVDISDRKQMERQQREHQDQYERLLKLEVTNQTIAAIAHELNQPLCAAASFSDASHRLLQRGDSNLEKALYALEQTSQQIQRAGQVVHELFKFLRTGEVFIVPINLNQLIRQVVSELKQDGHLGEFKAVLNLDQNLPPVNANALQLKKVLINLIRNSIEAMQEAGMVLGSIRVSLSTADNLVCAQVTICDNGPGLDGESAQQVFEPLYSTKQDGLGMGLAISRALIEAQGGQLWCQPDDSSGACFHLTLPFAQKDSL